MEISWRGAKKRRRRRKKSLEKLSCILRLVLNFNVKVLIIQWMHIKLHFIGHEHRCFSTSSSSSSSSHIYFFICECGKYFKCFTEQSFLRVEWKRFTLQAHYTFIVWMTFEYIAGDVWQTKNLREGNEKIRKKFRFFFCFMFSRHPKHLRQ